MAAYKCFVDFHGELLLLLHWSLLAYTGLVKILKKHLKRTGLPVRAPQLENLLSQPFCSVEVRIKPWRCLLPFVRLSSACLSFQGRLGCSAMTQQMWHCAAYGLRTCDERLSPPFGGAHLFTACLMSLDQNKRRPLPCVRAPA